MKIWDFNHIGSVVSIYDVINVGKYVWRQRHNVRVYGLLVSVKLNNSDKECGCSYLMYM